MIFATLALLPLLATAIDDQFLLVTATRIMIFALAALSLDLILGYGALVSFGHAAFIGLGAYSVAILAAHGIDDILVQSAVAILVCSLFAFVTGVSILLTGSLFVTCWRQFRSISRRQRDRLMDVDALKNVLAQLDLVALLLRNRPPLPNDAKSMRDEVRGLLARSAIRMTSRELSVLCSLLRQRQADTAKRGTTGLDVLASI